MRIDLERLVKTTLPQEIARSIFHWQETPAAEWKSILVKSHLDRNYITVNWWSCDRHLLKFRVFDDGELFAGTYIKPENSDDWILERTDPVSTEYILFTILKEYLL